MKRLLSRKLSFVFIIIQFIITLGVIGLVLFVDMLPDKYLIALILCLIFIMAYTFFSQMSKKFYIVGRVISGIFCVLLCVASAYLIKGYTTLNKLSDANIKVDEMSAIVLIDDSAETIEDVLDYNFGIVDIMGRDFTDSMLETIETEHNVTLQTHVYSDYSSLVEGLYNKEVGVVIFNEAFREVVIETFENFSEETKILGNHEIETIVEVETEEDSKKKDIRDPFIIYCSGIDTFGTISKTSRSDVNIIAIVNPGTSQILLVNTPRDYYVPLSISNGVSDKLTHAGNFGVDVSIETLENLYDIDVDYYIRLNFTGLTDIVNALGGVSVYSDVSFKSDWGPSFSKGYNNVNGDQALAFCRERHHFSDGDRQRGKNHQHMIAAILDKVTSPSIITNFNSLMNSIEGSFETNMKTKMITKYVKFQIDEKPEWNIESISVDGTGGKNYTYSMPSQKSYVMYPNEETVVEAKECIQKILDGELLKSVIKEDTKEN